MGEHEDKMNVFAEIKSIDVSLQSDPKALVAFTLDKMIDYYSGDPKRINHFLKVYEYARLIAIGEGVSEEHQLIIELAAVVHDIGIKISEQKYNSSSGKYQEIEGPSIAYELLNKLKLNQSIIDRICHLVGNHHSYNKIDDIDFQILIEADFLVNIYEDNMSMTSIFTVADKYFKTATGKRYIDALYLA